MNTDQTNKLFQVAEKISKEKGTGKDIVFWIAEQIQEFIDKNITNK